MSSKTQIQVRPVETKEKDLEVLGLFLWYTRKDSNLRPSVPKTDALIH